jgi:hypothetical protein
MYDAEEEDLVVVLVGTPRRNGEEAQQGCLSLLHR